MKAQELIAAIVQQTTVLIAQISTAAGIRAPLAGIADQVFVSLAREIEAQGVGRKVVADMFGLAIRSYQKKVQRLAESQTVGARTLWEAVLDHVRAHGPLPRSRLLERFARDPEREVTAVLNDLVTSGLVYASGRGEGAIYGVTSEADRRALDDVVDSDALAMRVWAHVFEHPGTTASALIEAFTDTVAVQRAVEQLLSDSRLRPVPLPLDPAAPLFAEKLMIPVGVPHGWEVAVMQHHRAVTAALAAKVRQSGGRSAHGDRIGGATYTFGVHDGHPNAEQVYALLASFRAQVEQLFRDVSSYNDAHPEHEGKRARVTFYFGQNVVEADAVKEPQ